jgi:hypothetical protein
MEVIGSPWRWVTFHVLSSRRKTVVARMAICVSSSDPATRVRMRSISTV